jgi:lipopolysaccharide export system protein LptA
MNKQSTERAWFESYEVNPPVMRRISTFPYQKASADAFISEDRVYYGADTYTVDYAKEIITATGHAYFKKGERTVRADRIVIYYAKAVKKALFYDNVVVEDFQRKSEVRGDYGEARYNEEFYLVEGNAVYTDHNQTVRARKIELYQNNEAVFSGNVRYSSDDYEIESSSLRITEEMARFTSDVQLLYLDNGDTVDCSTLDYFFSTGDVVCRGNVLYQQAKGADGTNPLVAISDGIYYFKERDSFTLLGDVLITTGDVSLNTNVGRYGRSGNTIDATGDVVARERGRYVYCDSLTYDMEKKKLIYYDSVQGVIPR